MLDRFRHHWRKLPRSTRRPIVLTTGMLLILVSALIGWLPGPGGMFPFLLGIAVLATEFTWAERFRDYILDSGSRLGKFFKKYPKLLGSVVVLCTLGFWTVMYFFVYKKH